MQVQLHSKFCAVSLDVNIGFRILDKQEEERKRGSRGLQAWEQSRGAGSTLCCLRGDSQAGTQKAVSPLTLFLDRGSAAFCRAFHNQLTCKGHEFLNTGEHKHMYNLLSSHIAPTQWKETSEVLS